MIEVQSLLLGSNLLLNKKEIIALHSVSLDMDLSIYEPIPISTKKLTDMGFRRIGRSRDWVYKNAFLHRRLRGWITKKSDVEIKYIHEVQLFVYCKTRKLLSL